MASLAARLSAFVQAVAAEFNLVRQEIAAAGSGGYYTGTAEIDFGAFPGSPHATAVIVGQAGIVAGSTVEAWVFAKATADHSEDEHLVDPPRVAVSAIVAGTGFTINGLLREPPIKSMSLDRVRERTANPPLIYGRWSVAWRWK